MSVSLTESLFVIYGPMNVKIASNRRIFRNIELVLGLG